MSRALNCPKCRTDLRVFNWKNVEVDICDDCHGIWFDKGEILEISKSDTLKNIDDAFEGVHETPGGEAMKEQLNEDKRLCPVDGAELARHQWMGDTDIVIDSCHECMGVWLDAGELEGYVAYQKDIEESPAELPPEVLADLQSKKAAMRQEIFDIKEGLSEHSQGDRFDSKAVDTISDFIWNAAWAVEKKLFYKDMDKASSGKK